MEKETVTEVRRLVKHVAMSPPGIRMYVAMVCLTHDLKGALIDPQESFGRQVCPVVAVRSVVTIRFWKKYFKGAASMVFLTAEEYDEDGWDFGEEEHDNELLIVDEEYGLIAANDSLMSDIYPRSTTVLCPWPYDKDADAKAVETALAGLQKVLIESYANK